MAEHHIRCTVNGQARRGIVESRTTLADFLREGLGLTGTHLACEHGVCGACTVTVDGRAIRSCLMLAVQAEGATVTTVEGLAGADGTLSPVQQAFMDAHGLQCGFCTPGFVMSVTAFLEANPDPTDAEIREGISGNLCRCTGYQGIVAAVRLAATRRRAAEVGA
ncbi:MAG: (2Fe-2S)-binding protein [Actinomycetota bacterium]